MKSRLHSNFALPVKRISGFFHYLLLVFLGLVLLSSISWAQEKNSEPEQSLPKEDKISVATELDVKSKCVWRGFLWTDGPTAQPTLYITHKNLTLTALGYYNMAGVYSSLHRYNETDLSLTYSAKWKKMEVRPSFDYYTYHGNGPSTAELSVTCSYPIREFTLKTYHALDVIAYRGGYYGEIGAAYTKQLRPRTGMEVYLCTGWANATHNNAYLGINHGAWYQATGRLSLTYRPVEKVYFRPHIDYSVIFDQKIRSAMKKPDNFVYGIAVGTEF